MSGAAGKLASNEISFGSPCTSTASKSRHTRSAMARCRAGSSRHAMMSRTEQMTGGRGVAACAAAISGSNSKAKARRANGKPSMTTASGRAAANAASNASCRRARNVSPIGWPASSTSAKLASRARTGSSCTTRTLGSAANSAAGGPPLTRVTVMPSCASAPAIRSERCRCPMPSRYCTCNRTDRLTPAPAPH